MEEDQKNDIFQSPPEYHSRLSRPKPKQSPIKKVLIILLFIVVLGIILFGAFRLITGGSSDNEQSQEPTPTIESFPTDIPDNEDNDEEEPSEDNDEEDEPTPTEEPDEDSDSGLDRSDLSIHVLNGNGVSGASSEASDFLEDLGYNVIQIGNAENFDYEQTEIQIKRSQSDFLELLESDLSDEYTVGSTSTNLSEDETPDALVIIGAE